MTDSSSTMPRRWGVWCDDPAAAVWLKALTLGPVPPAFVAVRRSAADDIIWQGMPRVEFVADWQTLLIDRTVEAVFIAGTSDDQLAAMRQFAEQSRPLWIWPDAAHGLPFAYELALIASDRPQQLRGVWDHRRDAVLQAVAAGLQQGTQPPTNYIEIERTVSRVGLADGELPAAMQRWLLMDLDLGRWLGGQATRVTSLHTMNPQGTLWKQSALLAAESGKGMSWIGEVDTATDAAVRVRLHHSGGTTVLSQRAAGPWSLEGAGESALPGDLSPSVPWADVVQVFEWFDACDHSLSRKRTIELHSEPVSERTVFKTQMTAMGCLVLMATLLFALVYLAVGAAVPLPGWMLVTLRALVFTPLALFLLAQLLLPLARLPKSPPGSETGS